MSLPGTGLMKVFMAGRHSGAFQFPGAIGRAECANEPSWGEVFRRILAAMPVAIGCQNGAVSPHSSQFQVIGRRRDEYEQDPSFKGIC